MNTCRTNTRWRVCKRTALMNGLCWQHGGSDEPALRDDDRVKRTFLQPEEQAYNTATGTVWGSNRRGWVQLEDGRRRWVTLGVPDTFFTIPALAYIDGKRVKGYVTSEDDGEDSPLFVFHTFKTMEENDE